MSELPPITRIVTAHAEDGLSTAKAEQLEIPVRGDIYSVNLPYTELVGGRQGFSWREVSCYLDNRVCAV